MYRHHTRIVCRCLVYLVSNGKQLQARFRPLEVEFCYGLGSRTRPNPSSSGWTPRRRRRISLLRRQTPPSPRPPPRRHRPSRRTHHLLLPDSHLSGPQPRSHSTLLASWTFPQVTALFSDSLTSFLDFELRTNKRLDSFLSRQPQACQFPLALQINMKIKKRAAFALRRHPLRQFRQ